MKKIASLFFALVLFISFSGIGQAEKYELKIQTSLASSSMFYKTLERLKKNIEDLSGNQIKVELFADGAIVKSFEIFDSVSDNIINGGQCCVHK